MDKSKINGRRKFIEDTYKLSDELSKLDFEKDTTNREKFIGFFFYRVSSIYEDSSLIRLWFDEWNIDLTHLKELIKKSKILLTEVEEVVYGNGAFDSEKVKMSVFELKDLCYRVLMDFDEGVSLNC